jgi:hypothetical protein
VTDAPLTNAQRTYLDRFMAWLYDSTPENLRRRREALASMLSEAALPLVRLARFA